MEDVLDVYARPPDPKYPVVCLDEARKELHGERCAGLAAIPGHVQKQDYQYTRLGTISLFLAVEPLMGKRWVWCAERQTRLELAEVLRDIALKHYPSANKIVLVTDNLKTHGIACMKHSSLSWHVCWRDDLNGITRQSDHARRCVLWSRNMGRG